MIYIHLCMRILQCKFLSLIENKPKDKIVVKFNTNYNKNINSEYEISSLKELDETLQKLEVC
jgi:hypothetical protein